ncbi:MAG: efflux RND transporter periplasmic adaptor subunit [Patescibacteria group bacterium]
MSKVLKKFFGPIVKHKLLSLIALVIIVIAGYFGYQALKGKDAQTSYVSAAAEKGSIIASVSGSGQVSASNQVDIKTRASGEVYAVNAKEGQEVKANTTLVQLDAREAQKSIRDAQANLESAQIALEKIKQPTDELSILQAENSLAQAKETKQNSEDALKKAYDDGFNTVANSFLGLPTIMTGLNDIIYGHTFEKNQQNVDWYVNQINTDDKRNQAIDYRDKINSSYSEANDSYDKNLEAYKAASRTSDNQTIESIISETYETVKIIADTVKNGHNLIDFVRNDLTEKNMSVSATIIAHQASLDSYTGNTNTYLLNLLSVKNTIQTNKQNIINADRSIAEKTESLANLEAGVDALDLHSQELNLQQKINALSDAREKLSDYYVRAPFDGVVASVNINKGDSVSSGASAVTMITKQQIAKISLNEVDVAKVKVGQKTTLTFDAVGDLTIAGSVINVDLIGTVSQGVTSYNVEIGFDTQDERIKPGMTVLANIITESKTDVLLIPSSAIKTQGDSSYVEILENGQPLKKEVSTGLVGDTMTEILSGLNENDQIITKTITSSQNNAENSNSSSRAAGGNQQNQDGMPPIMGF